MSKNGDVFNKPWALYTMSGLFLALAIGSLVLFFTKEKNVIFLIIAGVFALVGLIILPIAIVRGIQLKKYKALISDNSAYVTKARFVGSRISNYSSQSIGVGKLNVPVAANVYRKIIYTYYDENGVQHTVKSKLSYFKNQVEYLKNMEEFAIKCKGKLSAIIEPVPENNKDFNF